LGNVKQPNPYAAVINTDHLHFFLWISTIHHRSNGV
jgi:hypothetical protein